MDNKEIIAAAKQDLSLLVSYRNEIKNLRDRASEYRAMSSSLQQSLSVSRSASHRAGNAKIERALDLLDQIPNDIESIATKYQQRISAVLNTLKAMENHTYRQMLEYRYISRYSLQKIALTLQYSEDWIKHSFKQAYLSYWETKERIEQVQ